MSETTIRSINSRSDYNKLVSNGSSLVVIDFFAEWCGPCRLIDPIYKRLSKEYTSVIFGKIDTDEHEDIAEEEGIMAMPVFKFYKRGKFLEEVIGGNEYQLREKLDQHK